MLNPFQSCALSPVLIRVALLVWFFVVQGDAVIAQTESDRNIRDPNQPDQNQPGRERSEFFESRIRPLLVRHCYECHSGASNEIKGGLRLDFRDAILQGGESGPALTAGSADSSLLLNAVRHEGLEMPPGRKLSDSEIRDLTQWVESGAFDPRIHPPDPKQVSEETFESLYQARRTWWSLQPIGRPTPPETRAKADTDTDTDIDRFIVAELEKHNLSPAPPADRVTLMRRASFAVTGLPPQFDQIEEFSKHESRTSWELYIDSLLASPHFGERWARHWMDVVRYTDTYGYEWDMPAKGAWRYRDYLIRAFNEDVPFSQLVREQIAGDLLPSPRINPQDGINESLTGPMFYQMGEKRHGDSAEFDGIHQEMLDNKIDAFGKAFLATTLACARCHDHKLDPVSQRDYYALGGLLMSARWVTNTTDLAERDEAVRDRLRKLKKELRPLLADMWQSRVADLTAEELGRIAESNPLRPLEDPWHLWMRLKSPEANGETISDVWQVVREQYRSEIQRRKAENTAHFALIADFRDGLPEGWSKDGVGLREITPRGDFVVSLSGDGLVDSILAGGLVTNSLSPRMNGAVRTPWTRTTGPGHLSFEAAGGEFAARRTVVDNAFLTERQQYVNGPLPRWQMVDGLGSMAERNVYVEFATKSSNPNFPPRVGLGGACSEEQAADPRSWFQISRVVKHVAPFSPLDELTRMEPLLEGTPPHSVEDLATRYRQFMEQSLTAWKNDTCSDEDVQILNWMLAEKLIPNALPSLAGTGAESESESESESAAVSIRAIVQKYREEEALLREPATVNGMADINPPIDYRLDIRGDYAQPGDIIPRGAPRFLMEISHSKMTERSRYELAEMTASPRNPLTARVYVNRVWHWLFGRGLVATPDDFGHAGETPSHPELLDHLSMRFIEDGWSTKKLIRSILLSRTWQQSQATTEKAIETDPGNRLLHHFPVQRLDAESLRDAMLVVSGRFDPALFGPTTNPFRISEDPQKRLYSGPLDGNGRRSIYTRVTIMEPPRFLATFNQPAPKIPTGRRDVTTTPAQSLTLLNDPFVLDQAEHWARELTARDDESVEARVRHMFLKALGRPASDQEVQRWCDAAGDFGREEQVAESEWLQNVNIWKAMSHAMFNTKEFLYLR